MRLRRIARWALLLFIVALTGAWVAGTVIAWPRNGPVPSPPPPARVVHFRSSDGVPIAANYWPGARDGGPAVLLLHGINNTRDRLTPHAVWLNGLGYAVLAIDFRGHGESGAESRTFGLYEARDAAAALAFLRARAPRRKVGVIGISLGGAAALLGDDGPLPVEAMVLHAVYPDLRTAIVNRLARVGTRPLAHLGEPLLSYQSWLRYGVGPARIAPIEGIRRYRGRVFIIAGTEDRDTSIADTRTLFAAAPGLKSLWLVSGADHIATSILWSDEYRTRVGRVFEESLGRPEGAAP